MISDPSWEPPDSSDPERISTLTCAFPGRYERCRLCGTFLGDDSVMRYCVVKKFRVGFLPVRVNRHVGQICGECRTSLRAAGWKHCRSGNYMGSPIRMR